MPVRTMKMGPGTLTIGDVAALTQFESQLSNCRVVPNVDRGDPIHVLSGEEAPGDRTERWTLAGTLVQDFGSTESKQEWLFTHRGEEHPFVFTPSTAAGRQVRGEVTVEAVEIGGDANTKPTADFEFQLVGMPTIGDPAP